VQADPKKIKLSENLLPNLLEKMNVDAQDDDDQFNPGPSGYSPNGRRSPDGILTKSEFKSAFQCKSLQKIQEDENEYKGSDSSDSSDDEDCIFAEQPKRVFPESVKQDFLKFNINLPTIIPFKVPSSMNSQFHSPKSQKTQDSESRDSEFRFRDPDFKNLQVMPYQPQKLTSPKERRVERDGRTDSPGARRRITAITDLDFEASLDMDL